MGRKNAVAIVLALAAFGAQAQVGHGTRRHLFESPKNFKESEDSLLDKILDEGEDEPGHKGHRNNKKKSAAALAAHVEKKEFGEHDIKVNVKALEETAYDAPLDDQKKGKVDTILEEAEVEAKEDLKEKKEVKKIEKKKKKTTEEVKAAAAKFEAKNAKKNMKKQAELAGGMAAVREESDEAFASPESAAAKVKKEELVIHECETVKQQVAFLVPTSESQMERSIAMLLSFERMGYGPYGDIKFIFQSEDTVEAFVEEVPKLIKKWNVTDTNAHRLIVELKENAIIHGPNQMPTLTREMAMEDGEGSARFLKSCKRLFALAHLLDTAPCDFKYAVFATPEGRFLPPKEAKGAAKGIMGVLGKKKGAKAAAAAVAGTALPASSAADGAAAGAAGAGKKKKIKSKLSPSSSSSARHLFGLNNNMQMDAEEMVEEANIGNLRSLLEAPAPAAADGLKKGPKKTKAVMAGNKKIAVVPDVEEAVAGTGVAAAEAVAKEAALRLNLVARLDVLASSKIVWGHNCNSSQGVDPGMVAARKRMETNAWIFAGGKTTSPRYNKVAKQTNNFDLFTLQSAMPVIELKTKGAKFLLELFRASGADPEVANDLRALVSATIDKLPKDKAPDFSDVLMHQFYEIVRSGATVRDASAMVPKLPSCIQAAPLLDAMSYIVNKDVMGSYIKKVGPPLMVPKGFNSRGAKGLAPLLEYERPPGDFTDGESIF